tara:strand:+ start:34 stop:489 length:456 start_codon:yes stop_codon:yes gene_type:complete
MKILKLAILFILLISNFAFANNKEDETKKSFFDFQTYYLSELSNNRKSLDLPDIYSNCQYPFTWEEIKEDNDIIMFFESKKLAKSLNKDAKSYFKLIQTEAGEMALEEWFMAVLEGNPMKKLPKPFHKIDAENFAYIFSTGMIYEMLCESQ